MFLKDLFSFLLVCVCARACGCALANALPGRMRNCVGAGIAGSCELLEVGSGSSGGQ